MHEAGHPKLALWDNQRDRVGREGGIGGDTFIPMAD